MKIFHCDHCGQLVYFENTRCVACGTALAYLPDVADMGSLEPAGANLWKRKNGAVYRRCLNDLEHSVCNWAIPAGGDEEFCVSCRLNRTIPDLTKPANVEAWAQLETAKRRLIYSLLQLALPVAPKSEADPHGLAFEFLEDQNDQPVLTGHADGVITLNIAEADDAERERRRTSLEEPYRTILGHFRHEIGHYYWDCLIRDSARLEQFRTLFGDERESYADALQRHYDSGPAPDWRERFLSAYASAHPWEDWAESWAHYLHMTDTLETAAECGLALQPSRPDAPKLDPAHVAGTTAFDQMLLAWFPLTHVLNILNRGLGLRDPYPFVIPAPAIEKLRFVHDTARAGTPSERTSE
ncbi:MAG: putative zinc-binding peptidase [Terrimicrobiaceae bacterium]|nr:putative zinc-binding peptidase [Terrimicrobiaceae bacterium]